MSLTRFDPRAILLLVCFVATILQNQNSIAQENELRYSVSLMAKIGACWSPSFSPDGKQIAFISDLNGNPQIWIVNAQGGWPRLITALDDPVQNVVWSPQGDHLAFSVAPDGGMNRQIYMVKSNGTALTRFTGGGEETNWLGDWTNDGQYITVASNRENPASMDAYIINTNTDDFRLISRNQGIGLLIDVSPDNKSGILFRLTDRGDNDLYLVDFDTGTEVLLTPHQGPGRFFGEFGPDGETIYVGSNKNRDRVAFGRIQLDQAGHPGSIEILAERQDGELQSFVIDNQGSLAVLNWNIAGRNELAFLNLDTNNAISKRVTPPVEIATGITFSQDGQHLAMVLSGAAAPRNIWRYDLETESFHQITDSPHAGINLGQLVRPELVRFFAHDSLALTGWLYRPDKFVAPGPVVLSFHGGPESQERPRFNNLYQALLSQGIAVFAPNVRGSSGFGKEFMLLGILSLVFDILLIKESLMQKKSG